MKIDIGINNLADIPVDEKSVKKTAAAVIKGETAGMPDGRNIEVSIVFVDAARMRGINKKYRKKDYATDVLSFMEDGYGGCGAADYPRVLGELVICAEVVAKDAAESGIDNGKELAWVVVHGMLHLFSYDHEKGGNEAIVMREKEEFYLFKIRDAQ
jgi:probable rRNA maturation factor